MNERIQKLLNEATSGLEPDLSLQRTVTLNEMQKFAELIVKECAGLVRKHNYQSIRNEEPLYGITSPEILEHFGIEPDVNENLRNRSTYFGNDI